MEQYMVTLVSEIARLEACDEYDVGYIQGLTRALYLAKSADRRRERTTTSLCGCPDKDCANYKSGICK